MVGSGKGLVWLAVVTGGTRPSKIGNCWLRADAHVKRGSSSIPRMVHSGDMVKNVCCVFRSSKGSQPSTSKDK